MSEKVPPCPNCHQPMQLNAVASNDRMKQYICGCTGVPFHLNVHKGQGAQ